ncbi:hypothetical protein AA313_de0202717 [Arthrobotrys entomopaga]|nr:hypothetical protein AA313_de0202717 [Arthrobotrys entomopaga]
MSKRKRSGGQNTEINPGDEPAKPSTEAAVFNRRILSRIQRVFEKNPEADLLSLFPSDYQSRLADRKTTDNEEQVGMPKSSKLFQFWRVY